MQPSNQSVVLNVYYAFTFRSFQFQQGANIGTCSSKTAETATSNAKRAIHYLRFCCISAHSIATVSFPLPLVCSLSSSLIQSLLGNFGFIFKSCNNMACMQKCPQKESILVAQHTHTHRVSSFIAFERQKEWKLRSISQI